MQLCTFVSSHNSLPYSPSTTREYEPLAARPLASGGAGIDGTTYDMLNVDVVVEILWSYFKYVTLLPPWRDMFEDKMSPIEHKIKRSQYMCKTGNGAWRDVLPGSPKCKMRLSQKTICRSSF